MFNVELVDDVTREHANSKGEQEQVRHIVLSTFLRANRLDARVNLLI